MLSRSRGTTISSNCFQICVALSFLFFMMLVLDSEKAFGWPTCPDRSGSLRVCLVHLRPIPPLLRDERWGWFSQAWFFRREADARRLGPWNGQYDLTSSFQKAVNQSDPGQATGKRKRASRVAATCPTNIVSDRKPLASPVSCLAIQDADSRTGASSAD